MENSDRELLEFAAKAAGYRFIRWEIDEDGVDLAVVNHGYWQPLYMNTSTSCDGDALRLAVKLHLPVEAMIAFVAEREPDWYKDPYAATRRAIVRAAAEIGRNMK